MLQRRFATALIALTLCAGCGVKAPPVAPEQAPEDLRKLDCSPDEPDCDRTDPKYKPKGPAHGSRR